MRVSELIELLKAAPQDMQVGVPDCDYSGWCSHDLNSIGGIVVVDENDDRKPIANQLRLCAHRDNCPPGFKTFCTICEIGCRTIWLVVKDGKPTWIENSEIRGPHDSQNRFEFVNDIHQGKFGVVHTSISRDDPLPIYPWMPPEK